MKTNQKGFIVPLLIAIVIIAAGGFYLYTKNNVSPEGIKLNDADSPVASNDSAVSEDNKSVTSSIKLVTYNSPTGFSISYPDGWKIKVRGAVDASMGSVEFSSPGTYFKYDSNNYDKSDNLEQIISVGGGFALEPMPFEKLKTLIKAGVLNQYDTSDISKIDDEKNIKIGGMDAYEIIYSTTRKKDGSSFKGISIILQAKTNGLKSKNAEQMGPMVNLNYRSRSDLFNQDLAERVFATFDDRILKTLEQKDEERRKTQATQPLPIPATYSDTPNGSTQVINSIAGFRITAENIYAKDNPVSYQSLCRNGILNVSGDSSIKTTVDSIYFELKVSNQSDAGIKCYSTKDKYTMSAQTSVDRSWCVDNTGVSKLGTADSATVSCK